MNRVESFTKQMQASMEAPAANQLAAAPTYKSKKPTVVVVTGAAGNIAYSIIFMIGSGRMLGDHPIELRLLDIPDMMGALKGVEMEVIDCAFPAVQKIVATSDYKTAFENADICLLIGAKPRGPGMQRKDLLSANANIFAGQGKAINQYASKDVKVVVVGNPANTNCMIAQVNAPNIPKESFSALTRLDQNRGVAQIAQRLKVPVKQVKNVIIWGNHSKTQYPDVNHAFVMDFPKQGGTTPVRKAVNDEKWLNGEFIETVQDRGAAIIAARKLSSAASAANAVIDHVRSWVMGTARGEVVSMAVISDGSYGVPKGLCFSYPVTCANGQWKIVQNLNIDAFSQAKLKVTIDELLEEKGQALAK